MFNYLIQGVGFILSLTQTPYIASYQTFNSTVLSLYCYTHVLTNQAELDLRIFRFIGFISCVSSVLIAGISVLLTCMVPAEFRREHHIPRN